MQIFRFQNFQTLPRGGVQANTLILFLESGLNLKILKIFPRPRLKNPENSSAKDVHDQFKKKRKRWN